jgi:hypothetical protein
VTLESVRRGLHRLIVIGALLTAALLLLGAPALSQAAA